MRRASANLHGLVLWVPMLPPDNIAAAGSQARDWTERRVVHSWDGKREVSRLFQAALSLQQPAWDVYLLYRRGARWDEAVPPAPAFWMHQLTDPHADPAR